MDSFGDSEKKNKHTKRTNFDHKRENKQAVRGRPREKTFNVL